MTIDRTANRYAQAMIATVICMALLLRAAPVAAQDPGAVEPAQAEPFPLTRSILPNGLRLWIQPREESKSVAVYLILRGGARYEDAADSGISHFVEHMLFTGTERWSEEEIKEIITARGGRWNGWAGIESTGYWAHVAAADFDLALDWLDQVVFHPTFPAGKVEKERQVIFEEKGGRTGWALDTVDDWGFGYSLRSRVRSALFPNSSLTQSVIGTDASLDRLDRDALVDHYRQYYTPDNTTLIIVGNIDPAIARHRVDALFGDLTPGGRPELPESPPLPTSGPHKITVRGPMLTDQITLIVGMRTTGSLDPDRWVLEVLAQTLDTSLMKEIRYRQGLVYDVSAYNVFYDDVGYLTISATSGRESRLAIQHAAEGALQQIGEGEVDAEAVARAKAALQGHWALAMEDNQSRAEWLADWATILSDDEPVPNYPAQIDAVTPEDVSRVVATYYTAERRYVGLHLPIVTVASGAWIAGGCMAVAGGVWAVRRIRRRGRDS